MKYDLSKIIRASAFGVLASAGLAQTSKAALVINEFYGSGGNAGATFNRDFVEVFNNGTTGVDLTNLFLQYGSATGAFSTVAIPTGTAASGTTQNFAFPAQTLASGAYFTIGAASGTNGAAFSNTFDATANINLSGSAGKLRISTDLTAASGTGTSVIDLVAFGATATGGQGTPAPGGTTTASIGRDALGTDTKVNSADFTSEAFTPGTTNSAGASTPEPAALGVLGAAALLIGRRKARVSK